MNKNVTGNFDVTLVENSYRGNTFALECSESPKILETGGLKEKLVALGCDLKGISIVQLTPAEDAQHGNWNKMGSALGHLGRFIAADIKKGYFPIGLLANCSSLMGMLAGVQHSAGGDPLKVGLIWLDAHGDFNTPETSPSGLMGGMPVAVSAGLCLTRIRLKAGLDPALPTRYIVMAGVRNIYPYEQELVDRSDLEFLSTEDITTLSGNIDCQMERLSRLTDIIYVHVDMDILNPEEVRGSNFPVPGGPTSYELSAALRKMFRWKKASAFGVASTPYKDDPEGINRDAAYRLIEGVIQGVKERGK
jgi:arginase family enzyme